MSQHAAPDGAGPLVRPYAMTHGRTRPSSDSFDLIALVVAADVPVSTEGLEPEHRMILNLARQPVSVAEISARADLPVGVVRILLDDLRVRGAVQVRSPMSTAKAPAKRVLRAAINGLRAL